jgi:transcription-repair coupling factor (superfamily II helicase)
LAPIVLLSKEIVFKDLGLLIVDEEQRFGVEQKEKIKELKTNVDVLTLTATPIPRTMQMSLVGSGPFRRSTPLRNPGCRFKPT